MPYIIKFASKQYTVIPGQKFVVDRLNKTEVGQEIDLDVLHSYGEETNSTLKATIIAHQKGKKLRIVKYKAKSNYHKQSGYRHYETIVQVGGIPSVGLSKEELTVDEISEAK